MIKVEYPKHNFKIKEYGGKEVIFDEIRKLWVKLTPEEWVRQNFMQYLIQHKNYPASLMAVEKEIRVGERRKRCDIVVYQNSKPWMIIECKEMNVPLSENVLRQAITYNIPMEVDFVVITNGSQTIAWKLKSGEALLCADIPDLRNG